MRVEGGMKHIEAAIKKLEGRHKEHIAVYGEGNEQRLTGRHETGSIDAFTWGVANRGASIRVPREVGAKGYGYFEDRRPAVSQPTPRGVSRTLTAGTEQRRPVPHHGHYYGDVLRRCGVMAALSGSCFGGTCRNFWDPWSALA